MEQKTVQLDNHVKSATCPQLQRSMSQPRCSVRKAVSCEASPAGSSEVASAIPCVSSHANVPARTCLQGIKLAMARALPA
eukprot:1867406-Alexandrium_andersonii.AAC.1